MSLKTTEEKIAFIEKLLKERKQMVIFCDWYNETDSILFSFDIAVELGHKAIELLEKQREMYINNINS